ncbi:hypothetical protein R3P38DRAFT_2663114 [Favolaschia claudopus]|uniref:DUF6535 domain-containing protein n=1 Tax=Favolaschia claudopus TaxID=2862362 RepID=A0AAV9ZHZ2_9AGAR
MEGLLIFAGLFSAVLTAFLIESYKTLNPDPGDLTVLLLARISEQIVASANGNTSNIPLPLELNDGGPTRAALACNALWFLSLGLSLSCALIATLLEQWAREFLHRTDIHSAPVIRARVFSFLYYGLRRFNMHAIVNLIPFLLHLSLLLFFSGLVAFLVPVNTGITVIAAAMLFVVATTYSVLTVFPLRYLDSPYRTPLTGLFWKLFQYFKIRWNRQPSPPRPANETAHSGTASETMVAAISRLAAEACEQRVARDLKALSWTVKSLADDTELEPFVDAISDMVWGPHGRREVHYNALHNLVNNPQTLLHARIIDLYRSCHAGILTPAALKRRKIICYKALCTTIPLLNSPDSSAIFPEEYASRINVLWSDEKDVEVLQYATSVDAMLRWKLFENDNRLLNTHLEYLQRLQATSEGVDTITVELTPIQHSVRHLVQHRAYYASKQPPNFDSNTSPASDRISELSGYIRLILRTTPHLILLHYLRSASMLDALPYFFRRTVKFLRPLQWHTPPTIRDDLDATFVKVVSRLLNNFDTPERGWMDLVMDELILSWKSQENSLTTGLTLHPELVRYLNHRRSKAAVLSALDRDGNTLFWAALANTLECTATQFRLRDSLSAAWKVLFLGRRMCPDQFLISRLLNACMRLDIPSVAPLFIASLKSRYLLHRQLSATNPENVMHQWLSTIAILPSANPDARSRTVACEFSAKHPLNVEAGDASVVLFAEYFEICAEAALEEPDLELPHEATSTLHLIMMDNPHFHSPQVQSRHQIQFANALRRFFESAACKQLRFTVIADTWLFRCYRNPSNGAIPKWLGNPTARDSVIATLTQYVEKLERSGETDTDDIVHQTHTILATLKSSSKDDSEDN